MTIPTSSIEQVIPGQGSMAQPDAAKPGKARRQRFRFLHNGKASAGLAILGGYVVLAVIGPWIAPYDPSARSNDLVRGPSAAHWLGTTHLGQDVLSQLLVGTRSVIYVGFLAAIIATVLSVLVGVAAGYLGGRTDDTLSVFTNVVLVIPAVPLMIIITSTLNNVSDTLIAVIIGTALAYKRFADSGGKLPRRSAA